MPTEPPEVTGPRRPGRRGDGGRWELPLFCLVLGGILWAASWIGGHPVAGLFSFLIMAGFGAVFVVGRRSESLRMMAAGSEATTRPVLDDLQARGWVTWTDAQQATVTELGAAAHADLLREGLPEPCAAQRGHQFPGVHRHH